MLMRREVLKHKDEVSMAVPKGLNGDRIVRTFLSTISNSPKLLDIASTARGKRSLLVALMESAALGLECDGLLGHAWIIPYGNVAKLQVGAQGVAAVARRSDRVLKIVPRTIYSNEHWRVVYGTEDRLEHVPELDPKRRGEPTHYYAMATLRGGTSQFVVWPKAQVEEHRERYSKGYRRALGKIEDAKRISDPRKQEQEIRAIEADTPWISNFEAMAHKTMVIQLAKWLPKSTELTWAVQAATREEREESQVLAPSDDFAGATIEVDPDVVDVDPMNLSEPQAANEPPDPSPDEGRMF